MGALLEIDISTTNAALLNEADFGSTVDFLPMSQKMQLRCWAALKDMQRIVFALIEIHFMFIVLRKKDQALFKTLQISSPNFALVVSIVDHVANYLNATVRSNVSLKFSTNMLMPLATLAFKTQLAHGSSEIKILTTNIASQVIIPNKTILLLVWKNLFKQNRSLFL